MKSNKIEKLILDLSTRWEVSPEEAVDRLNSMNESEINKLINSMIKKFGRGGKSEEQDPYRIKRHDFKSDTLKVTPGYRIISKYFYPIYEDINTGEEIWYEGDAKRGRVLYDSPEGRKEVYYNTPDKYMQYDRGYMPVGTTKNQESAKEWFYKFLNWTDPKNKSVQRIKKEEGLYKNGGLMDCLRNGGSISKCKCGCDKIAKAQDGLSELRQRGTTPAYRGSYPEFNEVDSTWVRTPDGYMKNTFSGNTLEQNLVTYDEGGIPRRSVRRITNYDIPAQADTTYRDARGLWGSRNPSLLAKLIGNVHSTRFMDNVDSNLEGFEPAQLNEREVKKTQKKACGGPLPKKSKFKK